MGALIELAAGFHPDLTGRENVFLNAAILGMSKEETRSKYDEMVDFAELQDFMDTPVKWYSSGMFARLGFSVAAHIDPDLLLVDEVLSVGDIGFQQKCEKKIRSFKDKGLTIVFVSHNMSAISAVCDNIIVLDKGKAVFFGSPERGIHIYTETVKADAEIDEGAVLLSEFEIRDDFGDQKLVFGPGEKCHVSLRFEAADDLERINIGIHVRRKDNLSLVFGSHYTALTGERISVKQGEKMKMTFSLSLNLAQGTYAIETVAWDQLRNRPLLTRQLNNIIIKDLVKTDGIAFLYPAITEFSITGCAP